MQKANILVSSARSGTNYFMSVFSKIFPNDIVVKEIFRVGSDSLPILEEFLGIDKADISAMAERKPLEFWQMIEARCAERNCDALAKIFYYHVATDHPLWTHFRANNRVIHLIRRSAFDTYVSRELAVQTGRWQEFSKTQKPEKIEPLVINLTDLEEYLRKQKAQVEHARTFFEGADYSELYYEDIATSVEACTKAICGIMKVPVPAKPVSIGLQKQKDARNQDLIANYADIAHFDTFIF